MGRVIAGRQIIGGVASGALLWSDAALSFWGGYAAESGRIIDPRHPLSGRAARGAILAIPETRGSSTSTAVLLEAVRRGTAPAAIVTRDIDSFIALAAVVAEALYGKAFPIVALDAPAFDGLGSGRLAEVCGDGTLMVQDH